MGERETAARLKGEGVRVLQNIASRVDLPAQQWWLSFADDSGLRGVVIVHAGEFTEAVMECNLHNCNPHGEVQGVAVPLECVIPAEYTYRVLSREQALELDALLLKRG